MLVVAAGVALMLATPMGLSPLFAWVAVATLLGAWAWAVRIGRGQGLLERPALRVVARRTAILGGTATAVAYLAVACVPGQIALPWFMVLVVSGVLGLGGAFASLVLTLCGMDAARGGGATSPPA